MVTTPRAQQLRDLLCVGQVSLVASHLPSLAHPEGRERIDDVIPKRALRQRMHQPPPTRARWPRTRSVPDLLGGLDGTCSAPRTRAAPAREWGTLKLVRRQPCASRTTTWCWRVARSIPTKISSEVWCLSSCFMLASLLCGDCTETMRRGGEGTLSVISHISWTTAQSLQPRSSGCGWTRCRCRHCSSSRGVPGRTGMSNRFNGKLRDELLDREIFYTLTLDRTVASAVQYSSAAQRVGLSATGPGSHQPSAPERHDHEPSSLIRTGSTLGGGSGSCPPCSGPTLASLPRRGARGAGYVAPCAARPSR